MYREIKERVGRLTERGRSAGNGDRFALGDCQGPTDDAWIEIIVASRTDAYLRETVSAATDRSIEFISKSFKELFRRPRGPATTTM